MESPPPPASSAASLELSTARFRLAVIAGTALVCGLVAMLILRSDESAPPPADLTTLMLAAVQPARSASELITPLPTTLNLDARKVALGRKLFNDARLSRDNTISCANCHNLATSGADKFDRSFGIGGAQGARNAPTVFNSGFNFRQFWDGRALTLEQQVDGPVTNAREMGSTWPQVVAKLTADEEYQRSFAAIYGKAGVNAASVRDAIATFERSLVTPDAPFDRWLRGDKNALSADASAGYQLFKSYGCISCHQGANVGGNLFVRLGVVRDFYAERELLALDPGRFNVTGNEQDRHKFKVPGLRNVALTAPYFHNGSVQTLREAIELMARHQLGVEMPERDAARIEAFLGSLTGRRPAVQQ